MLVRITAVVAVLMVGVVVLTGCSATGDGAGSSASGTSAAGVSVDGVPERPSPNPESSGREGSGREGSGPSGSAQDSRPTLPPLPDDRVDPVLDEIFTEGMLSDDERACVAQRVHESADAKSALGQPDGSGVASKGRALVIDLSRRCMGNALASSFADGLQQAHGGSLSSEQISCARDRFSNLSQAEVEAVAQAGLGPVGTAVSRGQEVVAALLAACRIS